jgi:hypothetical protein
VGSGIWTAALASLAGESLMPARARAAENIPAGEGPEAPRRIHDQLPREPHFAPRAKSVIHLFMNGGPSQMDLLDPKPELDKHHGESYFDKIAGEVENPTQAGALMRSSFQFKPRGQCGMEVSDALPHLAQCVDDIALIRSMYTTNLTHEPALYMVHCGRMLPGLPSMGAWTLYGLGSENQNLPGYVVLDDPRGLPVNRHQNWQAGFLPPVYQGTRFRSTGAPVLNLASETGATPDVQRAQRKLIAELDELHRQSRPGQPVLDARIASYALAARMQMSASDVLDISNESAETLAMYGIGEEPTDNYGRRCLIARRLVERGVRFVQLFIDNQIWDNHANLATDMKRACERTDRPIAGLLKDLKRRGLMDQVLVVWGGEMGRLPIAQLPADKDEFKAGRDHNKNAMCTWMAGGGIKGGTIHGATDELGLAAVENRVSIGDWHATILHQLGIDYERLFFDRNGLKEKLTGVAPARVIREILA